MGRAAVKVSILPSVSVILSVERVMLFWVMAAAATSSEGADMDIVTPKARARAIHKIFLNFFILIILPFK
jgi:hypothetical protein